MKKIIISFLLVLFMIVNVKAYSFNEVKDISNTYINRETKNFAYMLYDEKLAFKYENKIISFDNDFVTGGLINDYEFNVSKYKDETYLFSGLPYFTLQGNVIKEGNISNGISDSNGKITEYIKKDTRIKGKGSYKDPFVFEDKYLVEIISDKNIGTFLPNVAFVYPDGVTVFNGDIKSGYSIKSVSCDGAIVNDNSIIVRNINKDTKCEVIFQEDSVVLKYESNGGSKCDDSVVYYNKPYGNLCMPEKTGYTFGGWFSSDKEDAIEISNSSIVSQKDEITLYARWEKIIIDSELIKNGYACNTDKTDKLINYTGDCLFIDDSKDGVGEWRIKFLTSGVLTTMVDIPADIFLVGGGGGSSGPAGAGGGYTKTFFYSNEETKEAIIIEKSKGYSIKVGAGGSAGNDGEGTSISLDGKELFSVSGGGKSTGYSGGDGGSGGGGKGEDTCTKWEHVCDSCWGCCVDNCVTYTYYAGGNGGSYGNAGVDGEGSKGGSANGGYGGKGQGSTTCEFGEGNFSVCDRGVGFAYSGGGGGSGNSAGTGGSGGGGNYNVSGTANTGGGGGAHASGGSGVAIIRSRTERDIKVNGKVIGTYNGGFDTEEDGSNWIVRFLSNGVLKLKEDVDIDAFVVGGGAGGSGYTGGGGGYTSNKKGVTLKKDNVYQIEIGKGGDVSTDGGVTKFSDILTANGGVKGGDTGGNGGSGGGGRGHFGCLATTRYCESCWGCCMDVCVNYSKQRGGNGGSYGSNGIAGDKANDFNLGTNGGNGQGSTTCEFNEGSLNGCTRGEAFAYSAGGAGCGQGAYGSAGSGKSGNNSGRGGSCNSPGKSGIVAIRNTR